MLNENKFWEIIEKNKDNPLKFEDETKNMSIEDMWKFYRLIEQMEKPFGLGKDMTVGDFWHDLYELGIYELSCDEIMFRGKEFYDAFMDCDKDKIINILNKNPNWKSPVMTVETIQDIYGMRIANSEELEKIKNGDEVYKFYCFNKFLCKAKYKKDLTITDFLKERSKKLIETRAYKPSKLYEKALEVEKEIQNVFRPYLSSYKKVCIGEISKDEFINKLISQLSKLHGTELEELNNLWRVINGHINTGYKADEIYAISNIIHCIIIDMFFPKDNCIDNINKYICYSHN